MSEAQAGSAGQPTSTKYGITLKLDPGVHDLLQRFHVAMCQRALELERTGGRGLPESSHVDQALLAAWAWDKEQPHG